jgi:hypothetical protein
MMGVTLKVKRKFVVNGKEYSSVEEMPPELRDAFEKAVNSGSGVRIQNPGAGMKTKIVFDGKEYDSLDAMPGDIRRVYQSVMKAAETGEASPEMLSAALADGPALTPQGQAFPTSMDLPKPIEPASSFSPRWIMAGLLLLGFIFILYHLFAK